MGIASTSGVAGGRRPLPWLLLPLAALVWYGVGFLPQVLLGPAPARRGIGDTFLALPLPEGASPLLAGAFVGGALAGLLVLVAVRGRRRAGVALTGLGVAVAVGATLAQSLLALQAAGPPPGSVDGPVAVLALELGLATLVAWGVGALAAAGRVWRGLALALVAAGAALWWVGVVPIALFPAGPWVAAAVLAVALIAIGLRPAALVLAWPLAVLLSWAAGWLPLFTDTLNAGLEDGRGLVTSARSAYDVTLQAVLDLLTEGVGPWIPTVAAIAAAIAIALLRRPRRPTTGPPPVP
jgi:hypothetical protein